MKRNALLLVAALAIPLIAYAAREDTARFSSWPNSFFMLNGQLTHRATLTPDNTTAESNLTASGGTAVTYTFFGGEHVCIQAITTDAYIEFIAAGSMTAAGAKGFTVTAGAAVNANCFTLKPNQLSVSALCTAAGPCLVKLFEKE